MKGAKGYKKLLLQLTAIILPLFILMTAAIVWTVYNSTLDGFLEAQNDRIRELTIESLDSGSFNRPIYLESVCVEIVVCNETDSKPRAVVNQRLGERVS